MGAINLTINSKEQRNTLLISIQNKFSLHSKASIFQSILQKEVTTGNYFRKRSRNNSMHSFRDVKLGGKDKLFPEVYLQKFQYLKRYVTQTIHKKLEEITN